MTPDYTTPKPSPTPAIGDLRVWWIPQIPMTAFHWPVPNLSAARLLLDALAHYDLFQLEHNIKPDYSNAGGLQVFLKESWTEPGGEWVDWEDESTGDGIDSISYERAVVLDKFGRDMSELVAEPPENGHVYNPTPTHEELADAAFNDRDDREYEGQ